eukprot:491092_1
MSAFLVQLLFLCISLIDGCYYFNLTFTAKLAIQDNNCVVDSCTFKDINDYATDIYGVSNLTIINCLFHNISSDAIHFKSGQHPKNITINSNRFITIGARMAYIQNISDLKIINNYIYDIYSDNAIWFRGSGYSTNSLIQNNHIEKVYSNGIYAADTHINLQIIGNTIVYIGISENIEQGEHGMYITGKGFYIHNNTVYWVHNMNGNCISVRSYGTVSNNILFNSTKRGITYYSDHPGYDGTLIIENNIIYECPLNSIGISSNGNVGYHIGKSIVRFNTCMMNVDNKVMSIDSDADWFNYIYCNIVIRNNSNSYFSVNQWVNQTYNMGINDNNGYVFVDWMSDNMVDRDFHLIENSSAIGFCDNLDTGFYEIVEYDIDGDVRPGMNNRIDVGADQFVKITSTPTIYPTLSFTSTLNPSSIEDTVEEDGNECKFILLSQMYIIYLSFLC